MTHVNARKSDAARRLAFADAALATAGHEVTDPYLNELASRQARGELTGQQARRLGVEYILSR